MNVSWSHCVIRVRDVEALASFYCDMLGFRISDQAPVVPDGPKIVFMSGASSDHHQMALIAVRGPEEASSLEHNAFRVETLGEVKEMAKRLEADDRVATFSPVTHGNAISVYFADPEGNGIEVFCDSPWHVRQPQLRPWDPSKSEEEVLALVEAEFRGEPEFAPMAEYRAKKAADFGEG